MVGRDLMKNRRFIFRLDQTIFLVAYARMFLLAVVTGNAAVTLFLL